MNGFIGNGAGAASRAVLLIGGNDASRNTLAREFMTLGFDVSLIGDPSKWDSPFAEPELIICEDDLHRPWVQLLRRIGELGIRTKLVVVTVYGSVSSAVRAMRAGVDGYFAWPVSARQIVQLINCEDEHEISAAVDDAEPTYLTLGRAHWEYINLTLDTSGSIAEAARRLGVARRSLRRMLTKYPPAQ